MVEKCCRFLASSSKVSQFYSPKKCFLKNVTDFKNLNQVGNFEIQPEFKILKFKKSLNFEILKVVKF